MFFNFQVSFGLIFLIVVYQTVPETFEILLRSCFRPPSQTEICRYSALEFQFRANFEFQLKCLLVLFIAFEKAKLQTTQLGLLQQGIGP